MRVVLIASAPPPALELSSSLANLGHDVAALVSFRGPEGRYGSGYPSALHAGAPDGDLLFVRSGERLGSLLRSYEPDVALCASFPARIPDDALVAPRHGILNLHPSCCRATAVRTRSAGRSATGTVRSASPCTG
jgi:methionyl-tRNA formyltransferase